MANILGPGCSAVLAYHDGERVRFAVAVEGENNNLCRSSLSSQ